MSSEESMVKQAASGLASGLLCQSGLFSNYAKLTADNPLRAEIHGAFDLEALARMVIEAMQTPTDKMIDAISISADISDYEADSAYSAAIDAALQEADNG